MITHFRNYSRYDKKGRRLSIFADVVGDDLRLFVLTCSKRDIFSKKQAVEHYQNWVTGKGECKPITYTIPIHEGKPKKTFIFHCNDNYCTKVVKFGVVKHEFFTDNEIMNITSPLTQPIA